MKKIIIILMVVLMPMFVYAGSYTYEGKYDPGKFIDCTLSDAKSPNRCHVVAKMKCDFAPDVEFYTLSVPLTPDALQFLLTLYTYSEKGIVFLYVLNLETDCYEQKMPEKENVRNDTKKNHTASLPYGRYGNGLVGCDIPIPYRNP